MEEKKHFGVYEVIEEIDRGGMSVVYKAKHPTLGKMVAIKVLSTYLSNDATFIERFRNEAQLLSSFRHQNIVYVIDFAKEGNQYYLVMDLIDGYTVKQLLQKTTTLPAKIACNIIKNVCIALSYTHRKGIVHRDIKSSNIMVDGNGKIMVTDFGLSREMSVDSLQEAPSSIAGTLAYISPEQLDPKFGKPDERTDIYSLGVVFYEMITGRLPFDDNSAPVNLAYQHLKTIPVVPSQIKRDLLPKMDEICMKMLEKKQNKRYQNTEDLLKDLEDLEEILIYYKAPEEKAEGSYFQVMPEDESQPASQEEKSSEQPIDISGPLPSEEDIYIGKIVNHRYQVERLLLKRILSSLYEGKDLQLDQKVMIQIPNESRPTFKVRMEKEIQTMKKVDYPGFVKFIEVAEDDGSCYVIREYVDGLTIKQMLKRQKFDTTQAVNIILQVLESLKYLHDHGIIHRDLNSDVVIVSDQGQVKIISLGFTRVEDASSISSGEFLGVVQYTSPEQITQSKSDFRSDIYSIGILFFEMLTGTLPFDSPLPVEVMDMHLKKMPRLPEEAQKSIPLNLQRILLKALAKSPDQRYQTADEIIEELHNFQASQAENKEMMVDASKAVSAETDKFIKDLSSLSSQKTKDFDFSIKKKPTNEAEHKKVDVKQMIEEGVNKLSTSKQSAKIPESSVPEIPPPEPIVLETTSIDSSFSQDMPPIQEKPVILPNPSKKTSRPLFPIVFILLLIALFIAGWIGWKNKDKLWQKTQGLSIMLPAEPYTARSFQQNTFKIQAKSKQVRSLRIECDEKALSSEVMALDNHQFLVYFTPSLLVNQADIPVSLIGLNQDGKEITRTSFQLKVDNADLVQLVIKPSENELLRIDSSARKPQPLEVAPMQIQEEMFLPVRSLITLFNAQLAYDFEQEMLTVTGLNQHVYQLYLFKDKYQIDDKVFYEKTPYIEREDIGFLPAKFLTEKMGFIIQTGLDEEGNEMIVMAKVD